MTTKNAIEIIKRQLEANPKLKAAYLEEKRNYQIACKIREYRKHSGLTQKELAQLIGTKQSVISRLENAEYKGHSLPILKKISAVLHIPMEFFFEEDIKLENPRILTLHIPPILKEAVSFNDWKPNQIIVKRSYAG